MCRNRRTAGRVAEGGRTEKAGGRRRPQLAAPSSMVDLIDETRSDDVPEPEHEASQPPASASGASPASCRVSWPTSHRPATANRSGHLGRNGRSALIARRRQVAVRLHAEILLEDADPSPLDDCPICLQALESNVVKTPCNHKFHSAWCINGNRTHAQLYPCLYSSADSKRA